MLFRDVKRKLDPWLPSEQTKLKRTEPLLHGETKLLWCPNMQSPRFSFFAFAALVVMLSFHVDAQEAPERFRRVDRNGDGRLSRDEVTGPAFDEMDANATNRCLWKKPSRGPEPPDLDREVIVPHHPCLLQERHQVAIQAAPANFVSSATSTMPARTRHRIDWIYLFQLKVVQVSCL